MKRISFWVLCFAIASTGCRACCSPYDFDYPTFGGKWERLDRRNGRVGSAFYDASHQIATDGQMMGEVISDGPIPEGAVIEGEYLDGEMPLEGASGQ